MEIGSKKLHRHALPILVMSVGLLLALALTPRDNLLVAAQELTEPLVHIQPSPNGLSRITTDESTLNLQSASDLGSSTGMLLEF